MNIGERNEYFVKFLLVNARDQHISVPGIGAIQSVGFAGNEYEGLPNGYTITSLENFTDEEIYHLAGLMRITKAPHLAKADVFINGVGYSIKSLQTAPPALINHTPRHGFEFAIEHLGENHRHTICITDLDEIIAEYWQLRDAGVIMEDVKNTNAQSPFRNHFHTLAPILQYFLFTGSGSKVSDYQAEYILDIVEPFDMNTWHIYRQNEELLEYLWQYLVFSVRSKGMPSNYNGEHPTSARDRSIAIWTHYRDNSYKGSLHVRLTRPNNDNE